MNKVVVCSVAVLIGLALMGWGVKACADRRERDKLDELAAPPCAEPVFDSNTYDFGVVNALDGPVVHDFQVTNAGSCPMVISEAEAACGCITTQLPDHAVEPGDSTTIRVTFDPRVQSGAVLKFVYFNINCPEGEWRVSLQGEVRQPY